MRHFALNPTEIILQRQQKHLGHTMNNSHTVPLEKASDNDDVQLSEVGHLLMNTGEMRPLLPRAANTAVSF